MIESDPKSTVPTTATPEARRATTVEGERVTRRWPWLLALLLLGGGVIGTLYAIHAAREADNEDALLRSQTDALSKQVHALQAELATLRQEQQRVGQRLDATAAGSKVLREEILGMGERAALLEEAVARVSQARMGGESTLRLNEAEFLLTLGAARLELYRDAGATISAFALADDALAGLDDPTLATLRQTLAGELTQLREMAPDPRLAIRSELAELSRQLTQLPMRDGAEESTEAADSRLGALFGRLVTVRRYDPEDSLLGPSQRQAALATMTLQLELAQTALDLPDPPAFQAALQRLSDAIGALFDPADATVQRWASRLAQMREMRLQPELPALGATLRELRNLRAVRQVRDATPPALRPQPAATAPLRRSAPSIGLPVERAVEATPGPEPERGTRP